MDIRPEGAEMFHADGRTDRHGEAQRHFSQFCVNTKNVKRDIKLRMYCSAEILRNTPCRLIQNVS